MAALSYRPEIDGLRTVAVMPVILFHAGIETFSGGFVGVDVFFVISGYLITAILAREIEAGDFSILRFYERRARRILPALFLVMLVSLPFAWMWMFPAAFKDFGQSLAATGLFVSNVLFWRESGYFSATAELKPFLHTWSLAVEEQYYILFPPVLWAIWRMTGRRGVIVGLIMMALISLAAAEWASTRYRTAGFYLLPTRAWELLAGSLLALWLGRNAAPRGLLAQIGGLAGLALIVWAILFLDKSTPFPSLWTLAPVGGAALIILCAGPATWAGRVLSLRPVVGIGLISYSAYLWHQPLFAFARLRSLDTPPQALMLGLAAITLILAWLSWRFVERPFRNKDAISGRQIFGMSGLTGLTIVAVGMLSSAGQGWPNRLSADALQIFEYKAEVIGGIPDGCTQQVFAKGLKGCVFRADLPRRAALWGDSHAMPLSRPLAAAFARHDHALEYFATPACTPILAMTRGRGRTCPDVNERVLAYLTGPDGPDIVVMAGRWALAMERDRFDNTEGGQEPGSPVVNYSTANLDGPPLDAPQIAARMRDTVAALVAADKTVVLVGTVPEVGWHVPDYLIKQAMFDVTATAPVSTSYKVFQARNARADAAFTQLVAEFPQLLRIEPSEIFCDTFLPERCIAEIDNVPVYLDDDHLNARGATLVTNRIMTALKDINIVPAPPGAKGL